VTKAPAKTPPQELSTIVDFIRYAVTRFAEGKVAFGQGTDDPVEEAIFLVSEALGLPIDRIESFLPARMISAERRKVYGLIEKRVRERIPAAYLLHRAYLQGVRFYIDERVIVPRSYLAELLYSDLLFRGDAPMVDPAGVTRVLDLCTGSGCLAILACDVFPHACVDAVDLSAAALEVASINVAEHGLKHRINLLKGDLFAPAGDTAYDIILSNPPYVTTQAATELPAEFSHEPRLALDGGVDGLDVTRRILAEAPAHLNPGGGLLCEIGRGAERLQTEYPNHEFLWLDTADSTGEVFWIAADAICRRQKG
jgi:ribosomal protein L3 glutamine methyltransferase